MAQQDFDSFKQLLQEWMESHAEEYDAFEAEMNRKDDGGYQMVLVQAMLLVPEYQKIINKRINTSPNEDISDIRVLFVENNLAEALIGEFDKASQETIVPAMLCWLYFGQSFERMEERGEELRKNPEIPYHQRMEIPMTIKMIVNASIEQGLRTKEDWKKQHSAMRLADSEDALEWAINEPAEKRKRGRPSTAMPLPEMFTSAVSGPKKLIGKISDYLTTKNSQLDIARLKIALDELRFIIPRVYKIFPRCAGRRVRAGHSYHSRTRNTGGVQSPYKHHFHTKQAGRRHR